MAGSVQILSLNEKFLIIPMTSNGDSVSDVICLVVVITVYSTRVVQFPCSLPSPVYNMFNHLWHKAHCRLRKFTLTLACANGWS